MKKLLLVAVVMLSFSAANSQSHVIKANIFSLAVSTFNLSYEHVLNDKNSVQLGVFYTGASVGETKFKGIGITPEYRFYFNEEAPDGFYFAPFLRYQSFTLTVGDGSGGEGEATFSSFGGGAIAGRHWILGDHFSLDLFIGPAYSSGGVKVKTSGYDENVFETGSFDGFGVRFGLTFGLAF